MISCLPSVWELLNILGFFSNGMSNSTGVAIGLKKSVGIEVMSSKCVSSRLMLVDFEYCGENL